MIALMVISVMGYSLYTYLSAKASFPFPTYDFPEVSVETFRDLLRSPVPILFKNTLKYGIDLGDFCGSLADKKIRVMVGDYSSTKGRKNRKFHDKTVKEMCATLASRTDYGGNIVVTEKDQKKVNLVFNNENIASLGKGKLWIGPAGSRTPLHKDRPDNLALQIYGSKTWKFYNRKDNKHLCFPTNNSSLEWSEYSVSDYHTCPAAKETRMYEKTMQPGDMLYLPAQWSHDVTNKTESIMINFWY
jgi:hypothetical protein